LLDVAAWHDGYVAVGDLGTPDGHLGVALTSADGVTWQRSPDSTFTAILLRVVATATRLIAVGNRPGPTRSSDAWTSLDGRTWQHQDDLVLAGAGITALAARGETIVAVTVDASGGTTMWRSVDGGGWSSGQPPPGRAIVRNVVAVSDGFLAVGRDGEPDTGAGVGVRGVGRPAAWWSGDGVAWTAVPVEGTPAAGAQLIEVFRVAAGFFAVGSDSTTPGQGERSALLWDSVDARSWHLVGPPSHWGMAGANGQHAVVFAYDGPAANPAGWVSKDGRQWTQLAFTGDVTDVPVVQPFVGMTGHIDRMFVLPRGVLVVGQLTVQQAGHIAAWFADAAPR